jgi:PIN domain nuclease of toxin-antitoxin system
VRYLIDSYIMLWMLEAPEKVSTNVGNVLRDLGNTLYFSAVSVAELRIKQSIGKLTLPDNFAWAVQATGSDPLPFTARHAHRLEELELHHRDPFDRMLIAQAIEDDLVIVTQDRHFVPYPVRLLQN